MNYRSIQPGDFIENIAQNTSFASDFDLDLLAGRHIVVVFAGTLEDAAAVDTINRLKALPLFDGKRAVLLAVVCTGPECSNGSKALNARGFGVVVDRDFRFSRHFGAAPIQPIEGSPIAYRQLISILSPRLQLECMLDIKQVDEAIATIERLGEPGLSLGFEVFAPILIIPNVFETTLSQLLIEQYHRDMRSLTGSMKRDGKQTIEVIDMSHKVRRDYLVEDQNILDVISNRIRARVKPEIKKVHQFEVTRIERNLVGCYTAEDGGHFRAHRDNTTPATAHRKFALSINLNEDFDGGEIYFPEYGNRSYRVPAGGAVVFSCSLLHAVTKVRRGARFAYLPFLYDAEGSRLRAANIESYSGASFRAAT